MCGASAALGERAANTVLTATRQDGQALDGSQRPEGDSIYCCDDANEVNEEF